MNRKKKVVPRIELRWIPVAVKYSREVFTSDLDLWNDKKRPKSQQEKLSQQAFICLKSIMKTPEQRVKSVRR